MTNKEIANKVVNMVFGQKDGTPDCDAFALKLFIEALNSPSRYSNERSGAYCKENMEQAIMDILKPIRINGKHYMDFSEK
jgi:hypothetical protein